MAQTTFTASFSDTAEFERLEDGMYQAAIAGVVMRDFPGYEDKTKLVEKIQFIVQVAQDGTCFYFRTKPMACVIGEKSNLMVFLNSATGATLEKIKEKYPAGFPLENLIGVPVQAVVNTVTGRDGKEYANLANVLKAKKGTKTAVAPDAIPAYLVRGAKNSVLAEGLTVKEDKPLVKAATFPAAAPSGLGPNDRIDDRAPGLIVPGAAPAQGVPAGAKVTQAHDAQAWIQNPPAQPADAVPNVGATAPEEDDDSDLPF